MHYVYAYAMRHALCVYFVLPLPSASVKTLRYTLHIHNVNHTYIQYTEQPSPLACVFLGISRLYFTSPLSPPLECIFGNSYIPFSRRWDTVSRYSGIQRDTADTAGYS